MNKAYINHLFDCWARWVNAGGVATSGQSVLSKLIDNQGVMNYGSGGGSGPVVNCIEADIEAALMSLQADNPEAVELFRLEYSAIKRPGFNPSKPQFDKAHSLNISVRTYKRRLSTVRKHVINQLKLTRNPHHD